MGKPPHEALHSDSRPARIENCRCPFLERALPFAHGRLEELHADIAELVVFTVHLNV